MPPQQEQQQDPIQVQPPTAGQQNPLLPASIYPGAAPQSPPDIYAAQNPAMGQQPMSETVPGGPQSGYMDLLKKVWGMGQLQGPATVMGPDYSYTPKTVHPFQRVPAGPSENTRAAAMQRFSATIQNSVGQLVQAGEERKAAHLKSVMDRFTKNNQAIDMAKADYQQASADLMQANRARNPAAQADAIQRMQQATGIMRQSQTNLDVLWHGPGGERNQRDVKKALGQDPGAQNAKQKAQNSPESQALQASMRDAAQNIQNTAMPGAGRMDPITAGIRAQLPQGIQPSPEALRRQMGVQMGVESKPPSGAGVDRIVTTAMQVNAKERLQQNMINYYKDRDITKLNASSHKDGVYFIPNSDPSKPPILQTYTQEQRKQDPQLNNIDRQNEAKIELENATRESRSDPDNPLVAARVRDSLTRQAKLEYEGKMLELKQQEEQWKESHFQTPEAKNAGVAATNAERAYKLAQAYLGDPKKKIEDSDAQAIVGNYMKATLLASGVSPQNIDKQLSSMQGWFDNLMSKVTGPTPDRKLLQDMVNTLQTAATTTRQLADEYGVPRPGAEPAAAPGGESAAPPPDMSDTEKKIWQQLHPDSNF